MPDTLTYSSPSQPFVGKVAQGNGSVNCLSSKDQGYRIWAVSLHVNMSMLAWLLTALARLKADDYKRMRHMYIRLPRAGRGAGGTPAERQLAEVHVCQGCYLCPQHTALVT